MTITKIEHMINPEVLASMVDGELEFAIKFANLATVDNTLVGRPGNTVSLPAYKMIGEAEDVAEGEAIREKYGNPVKPKRGPGRPKKEKSEQKKKGKWLYESK